jgi:Tfp pilus assembly protein PilF
MRLGNKSPSAVLECARADRIVVQDFCPLADSIEWELGQQFYANRGNKAFIAAHPVPFAVNNDGSQSWKAAELFFASVEQSESEGELEDSILVLEVGIGVGLFAKFFLDRLQELCVQKGKDYYDRVCYVATDRSEKMLLDACRHGIFADHPGRYILRMVDALKPELTLASDASIMRHGVRPFRAVFLNYLLDCLPAVVLKVSADGIRQLCVRSYLARGVKIDEHTELSIAEVIRRARSRDSWERGSLFSLYQLFAVEYDFLPVDLDGLPFASVAIDFARAHGVQVTHNFGAVLCIEQLLKLMCDHGFLLINDYGSVTSNVEDKQSDCEHERFAGSTAIGINFPLLKACVTGLGDFDWIEPIEETGSLYSRIVGKGLQLQLRRRFGELFGKGAPASALEDIDQARAYLVDGRVELAAGVYRMALERQPWNWCVVGDASKFLTNSLRNPIAGMALVRTALKLNPTCSPGLWNDLGDCLALLGRPAEAEFAFRKALHLDPNDICARYNIACILTSGKDYSGALRMIADGMAGDRSQSYRKDFLNIQSEILSCLEQQSYLESKNQVNRVSKRFWPVDDARSPML